MQTTNTVFESELKKLITEEVRRIEENLGKGLAVKDYADYLKLVGQITAFKIVLDSYCDEVSTKLNQR